MRHLFNFVLIAAVTATLSACGGGGGSSSSSSAVNASPAVAGIATPSNVSVVTPNSN
jgi:predicted small lipoprotein YifL